LALLPVVKGLRTEGERAVQLIGPFRPEAVCLSVGREELLFLRDFERRLLQGATREELIQEYGPEDFDPSNIEEEVYLENLRRFGEVEKPPPCFSAAVRFCVEHDIPCLPLDMEEQVFSAAYVHHVTTWDVIRRSWSKESLRRMGLPGTSAEELVEAFDKKVNFSEGYRALERAREEHMAKSLVRHARQYKRLFGLIEQERSRGVLQRLEELPPLPI